MYIIRSGIISKRDFTLKKKKKFSVIHCFQLGFAKMLYLLHTYGGIL